MPLSFKEESKSTFKWWMPIVWAFFFWIGWQAAEIFKAYVKPPAPPVVCYDTTKPDITFDCSKVVK